MNIAKVELRNWRNFRDASVDLAERAFIVGPNASGKSNFLDAIRFLRDVARKGGGLQDALRKRGGLSKIRCLAARREPDVEIRVELTEPGSVRWTYELGLTQQVRGYRQPNVRFERVTRNGELILSRPDEDDEKDDLRLTQTHLEQINSNADFREIALFLESIRYLHLVPQLLRQPESPHLNGGNDDPFGRGFLEAVARTPEKTRRTRLERIESALRQAVPQLTGLTDTKDEAGVPHLEAKYEHWRPNAGRQREDQFSDGTLRLIGLFWALLDGNSPLLLEEPELSLNAEIVRRLPELFADVQRTRKRQIIISTHSWDLLTSKGIGAEEVVMLKPGPQGTTATSAGGDDDVRRQMEAGLSAADAILPVVAPDQLRQLNLF